MDAALNTYETCAAAATKARQAGFELSDDDKAALEGLAESIGTTATQYGFESADDYLAKSFGPYCTMEAYQAFMEEYILAASYLNAELDGQTVTDEDLENYFAENAEEYADAGIEKDDTSMVNVRHILIQPESVDLKEGDEGYDEAVQAAKDAAKQKAEDIYAEWQAGDKTEDSFADLAQEYSSDGSASDGGLIEEIYPGQTVDAFDAWCFDASRQPGDTDIVETQYGYHIIYFVGECGESYWHSVVSSDYAGTRYNQLCEDLKAEFPVEADLSKAAVYPTNLA